MSELPVIELAGSPQRMGRDFGERFREQVHAFAESRIEKVAEFIALHQPERRVTREQTLALARPLLDLHREYDDAAWAEFEGIAAGADIGLDELLVCNGLTDLRDLALLGSGTIPHAPAAHLGECSMFIVPAELAETGKCIVGQTWDMHADAEQFIVLVRRRPDDAPETLCLTTAGCLSLIGQNSESVSVGNTNLVPLDAQPGVNYLFTIHRALRSRSADEAVDSIDATPRLSGHNFYAADARVAIDLETTARRSHRTRVQGRLFVHTNHYLAESLRASEFVDRDLANTHWRQETLGACLGDLTAPVSVEACWDQLSRVTQDRVPVATEGGGLSATCGAVVQCPGDGAFHVCRGRPAPDNRKTMML